MAQVLITAQPEAIPASLASSRRVQTGRPPWTEGQRSARITLEALGIQGFDHRTKQQATCIVGKLEDGLVGGIAGKGFTQERDIVTELLEQVAQAVGHVVVEQELHSEASAICLATSKSISPRWSS